MRVLIYTRPPEHGSSITRRHWDGALRRAGLDALEHELVLCHAEDDLMHHLPSADMVVSSKADLRKFLSPSCTGLKLIFFAFAGVDHLAPFDWVPDEAFVVNNSGATAQAIGEYTIFALQLLANGIVRGAPVFSRVAPRDGFASLAGRSVTIVGAGGVGSGVAAMCKAFRMNVSGVRRSGRTHPSFDTMYPPSQIHAAVGHSDFVVIACPVTHETRGFFDASVIASMKPGGGLINIARGAIVDEDAVCDAIDSGVLGGAILDVVSASASDPHARVRNTPGILVTPHVSGDDKLHFIDNSLDVCMSNLRQFINGEQPCNAVDFELGY
jgi:phosphoglycerate dehydrogenase-like enzyme